MVILIVHDFSVIENDPEINVVVETIGGTGAALEYVSRCLKAGKNVVTSNKELISTHGTELLEYAQKSGAMLKFEASVGGGIPVLKPLCQCLEANKILRITAIVNGTTNFILTKMETDGMSFDEALDTAKKLGYAELNPSADVDGHDSARKTSILGGLAFGRHVHPDHIPTTGIRAVTLDDIRFAKAFGGAVKLICRTRSCADTVAASVQPCFVSGSYQLSTVNDVFNGIIIDGDGTGDVMFYGKGAGKFPTASAVISDIVDCVRERENPFRVNWADVDHVAEDNLPCPFYLRFDKPEDAAAASRADLGSLVWLKVDAVDAAVSGCITPAYTKQELDRRLGGLCPAAVYPVIEQ